jgi:hypothetical protein
MVSSEQAIVDQMNRHCQCIGTDVDALRSWIDADLKRRGIGEPIVISHPHLFSELPVFVASNHMEKMRRIVAAVELVVGLPMYRDFVLKRAPEIAQVAPAARGVLMGYDFHLPSDGPKLIEINTNAGGAMLNVEMTRAQHACCPEVADYLKEKPGVATLEDNIFAMFMQEWRLSRGQQELRCIAVVDETPSSQYLYPEFLLFQHLFNSRGIRTVIVSPETLAYREGALWSGDQRIDLVYNRSTDFYLNGSSQSTLAQAYRDNAVVLTPHPHAHALYANKHNLALLSDEQALRAMNVPTDTIAVLLDGVPRTEAVVAEDSERWWNTRKEWFFKPASGFGSRGSYRGDKITRKVFGEIIGGDYVAQKFSPPAERGQADDSSLKFDIRCYVYAGEVQLVAARLYQGQTTNFRTQGGGFAPVYILGGPALRNAEPAAPSHGLS